WNCKEGTLFFYINGSVPDDGFADPSPNRPERTGDCRSGPRPFRDPIAQHDTHHEGHSVIGGYVYHGKAVPALRGKYVFADFSLLFKFPRGPHDYGRLLSINAGAGSGLRAISELIVLPGGSVSLAVLGIGQDAHGEIYIGGNVSGLSTRCPTILRPPPGRRAVSCASAPRTAWRGRSSPPSPCVPSATRRSCSTSRPCRTPTTCWPSIASAATGARSPSPTSPDCA